MPRRPVVLAAFVVADAVTFALTIRTHADYRPGGAGGAPTVMSLGQLLGWILSVGLLVIVVGLLGSIFRRWQERRRRVRIAAAVAAAATSSSGELSVEWPPRSDYSPS